MKNRTEKRKEVEGYPESILKLQQKQAQEECHCKELTKFTVILLYVYVMDSWMPKLHTESL